MTIVDLARWHFAWWELALYLILVLTWALGLW